MSKSKKPGNSGPSRGGRDLTVRVKTARGRKSSSTRWLQRQLNDPYVTAANRAGFRSRAAFKLEELDDQYGFLKPGMRVVELGAAPGGWTQVIVKRIKADKTGSAGKVIAIDILEMDPVPGAIVMQLDFLDDAAPNAIIEALGGPADAVLSDMAPNLSGHTKTDHLRIIGLVEIAFDFAKEILAPNGIFVSKVFQGGTEQNLLGEIKRSFSKVRHAKPPASRSDSAEMFVIAQGFRKSENDSQEIHE